MLLTNDKLSRDRDALSDLALHFLNKMKIMVVKDIEREDVEFICKVSLITAVFIDEESSDNNLLSKQLPSDGCIRFSHCPSF